jgi:outer membrane receptor protein involved in Fe transport
MSPSKIRIFVAITLMLVMLAGAAMAQSTNGTIAGVVTDKSGAVVSAAKVDVAGVASGEVRTTVTGNSGEYRFESLTPGEYTITVTASGFAKTKVEGVTVRTSVITSNNVALTVASSNEEVTVAAAADAIQTESGELSKTISTSAIEDLPYGSQNPYSLAVTLPGVSTVSSRDDFTNGAGFSVNGLRPRSNNFLLDGFDNNDNGISGQAFQPTNTESVQEVTVLTNSYAAEYGRGGGSVSNLSFRSGSNNFHGAAWEQYSGARLDAIKSEDAKNDITRVPQYVNNTFGFRLGGPIKTNKLYFFGTSQWTRFFGDAGAPQLLVPTEAGFTVLNNLAQAGNANAASMIQALGSVRASNPFDTIAIGDRAGCPSCEVEYGFFRRTDSGKSLSREWTGRVDYNGTNDNLYVRYTDSRQDSSPDLFANGGALPSQDTQQGGPSRLLGVMWAHTFNPHFINEFRASVQQLDFAFAPTAATEASAAATTPTITLASTMDFFWGGFAQSTFPQGRGHKTFQFQDAASYNVGKHTMKIGADLAVLLVKDHIPFNTYGLLNVSAGGNCPTAASLTETCTDLQNYLDNFGGPAGTFSKSFGNPLQNVGTNQQAYYFEDSWKFRSNLTIDYGVRYEYQPFDALNSVQYPSINRATFATDPLLIRNEVKNDRNNFAPRLGFAYTPTFLKSVFGENKTVLRGGYGMFYDAFFTNISNNGAAASPNAIGFSRTANQSNSQLGGRGYANPLGLIASASAVASITTSITSVDSNFKNPLIHQWNLNVQRELPAQLKAEIAYVGTRGERLWVNEQLNPVDPNTGLREVPTRGSIVVRGNRADSIYHGLQTSVSRSVGFLQLRGSYTYSKAIDNGSEVFVTSGGASRWQDLKNPRSDRGVSAFDRTHRASISYSLTPPTPWKKGVLGALTGGWQTTGVVSFQSGTPETIYFGGYDQNGDGEGSNDRPSLGNPNATALLGYSFDGGVNFFDWKTDLPGSRDSFRYLEIDGQNGNIGRNSFRYPGTMSFDASVTKDINMPYREGHKVQLRMDLLNAFNHPNLGVSGLTGNILNSATFLNVDNTRRGGRSMVLWLKYMF